MATKSQPAKNEEKKPILGLRTFASDQAAMKHAREKAAPEAAAPQTDATPEQPKAAPEPVPQAAPIEVHKDVAPTVTKLDEQGEHIPAFHELSKTHNAEQAKFDIDDTEGAFGATVITDTKKSGFRLFPQIGSNLAAWWKKITTPRKKKTNTYAVPDADLRKGVIQKATSQTGTMFTESNAALKERIRQRKQKREEASSDEAQTTWTANTEPGFALLDAPDDDVHTHAAPKNVEVVFKKQAAQTPPPPAPEPIAPEVEPEQTPSEPEVAALPVPTEPEPVVIAPAPAPAPVAVATPAPEPEPEAPVITKAPKRRDSIPSSRLLDFDTNILSIVIFIGIIGFIVIFFLSRGFIGVILPQNEAGNATSATANNPLLSSAPQRDMLLSNLTPLAIEDVLQLTQKASGSTLQEVRLLLSSDKPLSSSRFFSIIGAVVEPSFVQTITDIRLAASNQPTRGILLATNNEVTARGGMLAWEATMFPAVNTIFRGSVASSTASSFVDEQINGIDVRILYTSSGDAKIVYGFIDDTTIAITPDHAQFRTVLDHQ